MVKIFVGNVASATTETELRALFEQHGAVSDCDILKNYGFVHMDNEDEAQNAVSALHKHMVNGSRITVKFATTKVRNATKIYVGKIPEGITVSKIRELFQPFGKVVECDIVKNYAFVHMQRENEALEAISQLKNVSLEGQKIVVSLSCNNQPRGSREDYFAPPLHHYPPYPPPRPPAGDFYAPRGRLPPPPLPPPPPRPYYERAVYERTVHHDPYAAASANYYERDPYERRPLLSHSPSVSSRFYRDRSPLGSHRTLLPPPPPPPPPPASYMRGYAHGPVHAAPPPPPPPPIPPASTAAAAAFRRYPHASGYEKDSYEEKYSNGYSASY